MIFCYWNSALFLHDEKHELLKQTEVFSYFMLHNAHNVYFQWDFFSNSNSNWCIKANKTIMPVILCLEWWLKLSFSFYHLMERKSVWLEILFFFWWFEVTSWDWLFWGSAPRQISFRGVRKQPFNNLPNNPQRGYRL